MVVWIAGQQTDTPFGPWSIALYQVDGKPIEVSIYPGEILTKARAGETIVSIAWLRPFDLEFQGTIGEARKRYPALAEAGAFE